MARNFTDYFLSSFINVSMREFLKKSFPLISANNFSNFHTLYELAVTAIFPTSQNLCRLSVRLSVCKYVCTSGCHDYLQD